METKQRQPLHCDGEKANQQTSKQRADVCMVTSNGNTSPGASWYPDGPRINQRVFACAAARSVKLSLPRRGSGSAPVAMATAGPTRPSYPPLVQHGTD